MKISEESFLAVRSCLQELADDAKTKHELTKKNIGVTNIVIVIFTVTGALMAFMIFYYFFHFNQTIDRSVEVMSDIHGQMVSLRNNMDNITFSVDEVGQNVGYLELLSTDVKSLAESSKGISDSVYVVGKQIDSVSGSVDRANQHILVIDQHFGRINHSVLSVSRSLGEVSEPVNKFFPFP